MGTLQVLDSNLVLHLPFDENTNSLIAYDYSIYRNDGQIVGATFVAGKIGNAIKFNGGQNTCEISQNVFDLSDEFSIFVWINQNIISAGSPKKIILLLNFSGFENYVEVPIQIKPESWVSVAITRSGTIFKFYVDGILIKTINHTGTLIGLSLNQDYYGGQYGHAQIDDFKIFNSLISKTDIEELMSEIKQITYYIDGIDFKDYGVYVSDSEGIVNRPKLKNMATVSWDNYHGESVDLNHKFYESREIILSCFIKANSKSEFISKVSYFEQIFDKTGTNRLMIYVNPYKPLIYEVYCKDEMAILKKWSDDLMIGTFKLKLIEPEPVKRILKYIRKDEATKRCIIEFKTIKLVNIYWGDGTTVFDVSGENVDLSHNYLKNGEYFIVLTGCIDEITNFVTNAIIIWNKI